MSLVMFHNGKTFLIGPGPGDDRRISERQDLITQHIGATEVPSRAYLQGMQAS